MPEATQIQKIAQDLSEEARAFSFGGGSADLFKSTSLWGRVLKQARDSSVPCRGQAGSRRSGEKPHPVDRWLLKQARDRNVYHSTCVAAKVNSVVGMGFYDPDNINVDPETGNVSKIDPFRSAPLDDALDPLCEYSFAQTLNDVAQDYFDSGEGYMEIVRDSATDDVLEIHHLEAEAVTVYVEPERAGRHFIFRDTDNEESFEHRMAVFGDHARFATTQWGQQQAPQDTYSEVINIQMPTNRSRYYGYPDWTAALVPMESSELLEGFSSDFFYNRGVPETLITIQGAKLPPESFKKFTDALRQTIGPGNQFKNIVIEVPGDPTTRKVQVDRLGVDQDMEAIFNGGNEGLALKIVSAHRVPPLLAGIQVPGKLGATNELPNALQAFHSTYCAQHQRLITQRLITTLGSPEANITRAGPRGGSTGGSLQPEWFYFLTITGGDGRIDIGRMQVGSRARQPLANSGRDLGEGLRR